LKANISRKGLLREGFTVRRRRGEDKPDKGERRKIGWRRRGKWTENRHVCYILLRKYA